MAVIWRKQDSGPIATVNGWFVGLAAGGVVAVVTTVAVVIVIFLAAVVIDIALSDDGDDKPDQPLGFKAFINSCQPLVIWCVAVTWLYALIKLGLLATAMWPSGYACGYLAAAGAVEPEVHLRYMATGILAEGTGCPGVHPGL